MATMKSATNPPTREQLLTEMALDLQGMVQQRHNPLQGFRPTAGGDVGAQVLDELRAVRSLVAATATPEETTAWGSWMLATAQAAADAAKEGGFMGFGAQQVSQGEQSMLDQMRSVVEA
jgi:hypothetical protein